MVTAESIRQSIVNGMQCEKVEVEGDGHHFQALVVAALFNGQTRIKRHRMVYATLGARMDEEVHALSIIAMTPEEYARTSGE